MITVRRRRNRAGGCVYQIWPDNLPANLPVPPWLPGANHASASQATIAVALAKGKFQPLPYDDEMEEATLRQADFDDFSQCTASGNLRFVPAAAGEGESNDRDYPSWG